MKLKELLTILKRLYREHVKRYLKRILVALFLSLIVAGSTAATAWLLDPAVKKIFIEQDKTLAWLIPIWIVLAFASKGITTVAGTGTNGSDLNKLYTPRDVSFDS